MKALHATLLALLVVVPVVGAQAGRVATDYIRIATQPAFQYRSDQDVTIPLQARLVRAGVPQPDLVHLEVRTLDGRPFPMPGGQDDLRSGVQPYPRITTLNFGHLEPGLYRVLVNATAGGLQRNWPVEFDVVYPPQPYSASLEGTSGHAARFLFRAHDSHANFTLTVYRDGGNGATVLQVFHGNHTTLSIPYIPGESVKVRVTDEHGWQNSQNPLTDWSSGFTTYPPYEWNPDYRAITNYQRHSWTEAAVAGFFLTAGFALLLVVLRRRKA